MLKPFFIFLYLSRDVARDNQYRAAYCQRFGIIRWHKNKYSRFVVHVWCGLRRLVCAFECDDVCLMNNIYCIPE